MQRALSWMCLSAAVVVHLAASGAAQTPDQPRRADGCGNNWTWGDKNASFCETREQTMPLINPVDIDAGRNGSIVVHGSDRQDVAIRSTVRTWAETDADARRVAAGVRVEALGGRIRVDGPEARDQEGWGVSFAVEVPRNAQLALNTHNGSIAISDFGGAAQFQAQNGSIALRRVDGDIHGATSNGSVSLTLEGSRWNGQGLDVKTRNGSVRVTVPDGYSAELETDTVRGRFSSDFQTFAQAQRGGPYTTTLGGGGAKLRIATTNGSVSIQRR